MAQGGAELSNSNDFEAWTTMKALMDAQSHSMRAMEQYALQNTHDRIDLSAEEYEASVEQAIENHRRAIENLEFALEATRSD